MARLFRSFKHATFDSEKLWRPFYRLSGLESQPPVRDRFLNPGFTSKVSSSNEHRADELKKQNRERKVNCPSVSLTNCHHLQHLEEFRKHRVSHERINATLRAAFKLCTQPILTDSPQTNRQLLKFQCASVFILLNAFGGEVTHTNLQFPVRTAGLQWAERETVYTVCFQSDVSTQNVTAKKKKKKKKILKQTFSDPSVAAQSPTPWGAKCFKEALKGSESSVRQAERFQVQLCCSKTRWWDQTCGCRVTEQSPTRLTATRMKTKRRKKKKKKK